MSRKENHWVLTKDKQRISFDQYRNGHSQLVVIAHGFFNSKDSLLLKDLAHSLQDRYDVIILDFRGHGKSKGFFSWTAKEHLDLQAVLEYASAEYSQIGVIGFSLGAAISMITAQQTDLIKSLIYVSGPTEFEKIDFRFLDLDLENDILYNLGAGAVGKGVRPGPFWLPKQKPIRLADKIKIPVFYIHGENDWLIQPWHAQKLYEKTNTKKKIAIIKNGPHAEYLMRENRNKKEFVSLVQEWFEETLS